MRGAALGAGGDPGEFRVLSGDAIRTFVDEELFDPRRALPIVAITSRPPDGDWSLDPEVLAERLGSHARVVCLATGEATWTLSECLPPRLDVYGGAARIWWPKLSRESDPFDHPLLFVHPGSTGAAEVLDRIAAAILEGDESAGRFGAWRSPRALAESGSDAVPRPAETTRKRAIRSARVVSIFGRTIRVAVDDQEGVLRYTDEPLDLLKQRLSVGDSVEVFEVKPLPDGTPAYSTQGLGKQRQDPGPPKLDPWRRMAEVYAPGDVVRGRIVRIHDGFLLVECLPGAALLVPIGEVDWTFVDDLHAWCELGDRCNVKLLEFDAAKRRGSASIKQALKTKPKPAVALGPGHPLFLADDEPDATSSPPVIAATPLRDESAAELREELDAAVADRRRLLEDNQRLRKELKSAERRAAELEDESRALGDPLASSASFLRAVRLEYARTMNEGDRQSFPLCAMRVGREFLARLAALDGISIDKVVEICMQVACLRAHEIAGREVHQLRAGPAGAPTRMRAKDGAKAWRCSLQDNTASARRLHWWDVPGPTGRVIEFASVGVHDDMSIPE
ncbi:MAG: S1 RNA-binding domain-containing protein [Planctomycetes bacterium]|nr:S1 RNA-binding domain-containing protein [Planctomycetota bacterium]